MTKLLALIVGVVIGTPAANAADVLDFHAAVETACGCKVAAVSYDPANRKAWAIKFDPSATPAQQVAGRAMIQTFDPAAPSPAPTVANKLKDMGIAVEDLKAALAK